MLHACVATPLPPVSETPTDSRSLAEEVAEPTDGMPDEGGAADLDRMTPRERPKVSNARSTSLDATTAQMAADSYLAGLAGVDKPDALASRGQCFSWCYSLVPASLCGGWKCPYIFGDSSGIYGAVRFFVLVEDAGSVWDDLGLARCFAATHKCKMIVSREEALRIAGAPADSQAVLAWSEERGEFYWNIYKPQQSGEWFMAEVSCH